MGKKIQYATEEDLREAQHSLSQEAQKAKDAGEKAAQEVRREFITELGKVSAVVTANADTTKQQMEKLDETLRGFATSVANQVREELNQKVPELESLVGNSKKYLLDHCKRLQEEMTTAMRTHVHARCEELTADMEKRDQKVVDHTQELFQGAAEEMLKQRKEVMAEISRVEDDLNKKLQDLFEGTNAQFKKLHEKMTAAASESDEKFERATTEIWLKLERFEELLTEAREEATAHANDVDDRAIDSNAKLRNDAERRLDNLELTCTKLHDAVAEVENLPTRRVDWVIKNVSKRIRPPSASQSLLHTSWFSPKFDMAGAHGLQLELQFFKKADPPVEGENSGDCAVFLWACKGMNLVYKLYVGTKSAMCEKIFNGRVPYGTKRLCFLKDHINREEDSLKVSVEILEAVREVEHPIKPTPALMTDGSDETELDERNRPLDGRIVFRRHVTHRLLDQVRQQAENMKSRMVRQVEWRLEHASMLRLCFPPNEPMCSVPFAAAGVDGMQLLFYPCGYGGATDGFCSLFLYAPVGATLKYTLYIGENRRDATHFFEDAGAFGRTNFCRFETLLDDVSGTIRIALEIEEAHQDVAAKVSHPIVAPGDKRTLPQIEGSVPNAVESVVKMHRAPGKAPTCLQEKRVLPSLWTAKSLAEKGSDDPNAMKSFDDIKSMVRISHSSHKRNPPRSPACSPKSAFRSSSSPAAARDQMSPAGTESLPNLNATGNMFGGSPKRCGVARAKLDMMASAPALSSVVC